MDGAEAEWSRSTQEQPIAPALREGIGKLEMPETGTSIPEPSRKARASELKQLVISM